MDVLNDDVVKYERPAARASEDGLERPSVAIYLIKRLFIPNIAPMVGALLVVARVVQVQYTQPVLWRHRHQSAAVR